MGDPKDVDAHMIDGYDEEADSDFDVASGDEDVSASSSDQENGGDQTAGSHRGSKRHKAVPPPLPKDELGEWDSGDEATMKEYKKEKRKQKKKEKGKPSEDDFGEIDSDDLDQGWRVTTRGMRQTQKEEQKQKKLASVKGSTIDVEKIWQEMNHPGGLMGSAIPDASKPDLDSEQQTTVQHQLPQESAIQVGQGPMSHRDQDVKVHGEELVTIKIPQSFAGETVYIEKSVPKSSAEAQEYLPKNSTRFSADGKPLRRPLRKVSRFDPNTNNLDNFKRSWKPGETQKENLKAKKITVVEKSGQDWVAHKEAEGLHEELEKAAKSKADYHGRIDFLSRTEQG